MENVYAVADWFLIKESMPHKKLQKLCYYAQAWSLALLDQPIMDETFQAWVHGPVSTSLWYSLKDYGYLDIPQETFEPSRRDFTEKENDLLEEVWATYGEFSGYELESITHQEMPWLEARGDLPPSAASRKVISNDTMKMYYRGLVRGEGIGE